MIPETKEFETSTGTSIGHKANVSYVFNHSTFQGGGEISFFELAQWLDRSSYKTSVIVPEDGEILTRISEIGIPAEICPFTSLRNLNLVLLIGAAIKLAKILKTQKADLIHVNGSRACFYAAIVGRTLGIPVIWHVRETIQDIEAYDRFLASMSSAIICVSNSVRDKRFGKLNAGIQDRISIVYNGIDPQQFQMDQSSRKMVRGQIGMGDDTLLGIVGNLIPLKGHHIFLKAFAEAKKRHPELNAKAIFLGRFLDTEYRELLVRMTNQLNLQDDVIFRGHSNNIPHYLSALDVFVLPSQREGCSRALLEAMSVGLPVIASRISEIKEVALPDRNAVLVEYGDVSQLAAAILKLSQDKKLRERLGDENRKRVTGLFTMQTHAAGIQQVYANLV